MIELLHVIHNGNYYGRFTLYPKGMAANYHVVYHPEIEQDLNNYKQYGESFTFIKKLIFNKKSIYYKYKLNKKDEA